MFTSQSGLFKDVMMYDLIERGNEFNTVYIITSS